MDIPRFFQHEEIVYMHDQSDKRDQALPPGLNDNDPNDALENSLKAARFDGDPAAENPDGGSARRNPLRKRRRWRRRAKDSAEILTRTASAPESDPQREFPAPAAQGYDPELLYVECARCGAPVLWEEGRAGRLLLEAGIDPLELDSSCILLTDGCPACGSAREYSIRIFRLSDNGATRVTALRGHA